MIEKYKSLKSSYGVVEYDIKTTSISVRFIDKPKIYTYSYRIAGRQHVEKMKLLAKDNSGLSAYISQNVRDLYDK